MDLDPVVTLTNKDLVVEPGGETTTELTIRNRSDIIEEFEVSVVGEAGAYGQALPPRVTVYPGDLATVEIAVRPPFDTAISTGKVPFGVFVRSNEDPERSAVAEGDLTIGSINLIDVRVVPTQARGRWRAKLTVEMTNKGTEPLKVRLGTNDPDEKLSFAMSPREVSVREGASAESFLKVRPRKSRLMGKPSVHPFEVTYRRKADRVAGMLGATSGGEVEASVPATFEQRAIIAKWMLGMAALVILIGGLVVYRARTNNIDPVARSEIATIPPPTNLTVDSGRLGSEDSPFRVSFEPADSNDITRYDVIFVSVDDLGELVLPEEGADAGEPYVQNGARLEIDPNEPMPIAQEILQERFPALSDETQSVWICALAQSVAVDDEGTERRSALVGTPTQLAPGRPLPVCGQRFGQNCQPPTIDESRLDETRAARVSLTVTYDDDPRCVGEEPAFGVTANGIDVTPAGATDALDFMTIDLTGVDVGDDGIYSIVVSFAGRDSEPADINASEVEDQAEQIAEEEAALAAEREQAQADAEAEAAAEADAEAENEAAAAAEQELRQMAYEPDQSWALVMRVGEFIGLRFGRNGSSDDIALALVPAFAAAGQTLTAGLDPAAADQELSRVHIGISPQVYRDLEDPFGSGSKILFFTEGDEREGYVFVDGFASLADVEAYCALLDPVLDATPIPPAVDLAPNRFVGCLPFEG